MGRPERYPSHREPDAPPPLPFRTGVLGNGETLPPPRTRADRWIERETLRRAEVVADRLGMDRRRFLQTSAGMALMLSVVNLACSNSDAGHQGAAPRGSSGPGGTYKVPPATDVEACRSAFAPAANELIVDVHTHHVMPEGPWRDASSSSVEIIQSLVPAACTEADPFVCLDRTSYVRDLLLDSDTAIAVLSDVPSASDASAPLTFKDKVATHDFATRLAHGGQPRVLVQSFVAPNFGELSACLDAMTKQVETTSVTSFKTYTAWGPGGQGYSLEDPAVGLKVIDHARQLGVKVFASHKGIRLPGLDEAYNHPRDMVAVAKQFPDMQFVIYHSAFDLQTVEGPYDPARAELGINSVVKAMHDYGLRPNSNVWCDLGTTWRAVMSNPDRAAHTLGKLLKYVGEDRVLWGTDAIWYGSPQPQIMAFRAFEITDELQERYGYPAITESIRAKVFGLNAAKLLHLDPRTAVCAVDEGDLGQGKQAYAALRDEGTISEPWAARAPVTRREVLAWLRQPGAHIGPG